MGRAGQGNAGQGKQVHGKSGRAYGQLGRVKLGIAG